jgi:hypothetical protein
MPIPSPSLPDNSIENLSSKIESNHVENFGQYKNDDDIDINEMIKKSKSYSSEQFNQKESTRNEINNSCEFIPSSNMTRYSNLLHGIPLYLDNSVILTDLMINQGKQLAYLLSSLAKQVFHIPIETMHLFRDIQSGKQILLD